MDIQIAAGRTRAVVQSAIGKWPDDPHLGFVHTVWMLQMIEVGDVQNEKAHRWLGWAQAATVAAGCATLNDMKLINKGA